LMAARGHLGLESQRVVPPCALGHLCSCSAAIFTAFRQGFHLSHCADFPDHLLPAPLVAW
jgi:hypothetical protein